ncbi:unnamed protein product [Chrysoparadoxa australica]
MSKRERALSDEALDEAEVMTVMPLGAGNEVGRSCIVVKYMGKTIMLDCGVHPGYNGMACLPFFDEVEPEEVDLLLITHFHLDHAAALPYLTEKTGFKGRQLHFLCRIFMTHPTKAVMRMLLADYIKLVNVTTEDTLYDEKDLAACIEKIELIDFHQVLEHEGIKFWCYNAGHVLGAAMFMIELAGVHILYTGDYSMEDDRHLMAAEVPSTSPDVLICESTYGVQVHSPREDRELRFTSTAAKIVQRGGRCLIPVFALGRAQELLLILDEYWKAHKELQHVPIYYASRLASKAIRVYQTYTNMMNQHIRRQMDVGNPFRFEYITNLRSIEHFDDVGPSVVMAAPGMLQSGVSRQLFDRWCTDEKNGVLMPGYSVEGTLAKKILSAPEEVTAMDGRVKPLKCHVEYVSFSAHVDFVENKKFIDTVQPANVILVHGEATEMMRLKSELVKKYNKLPAAERPQVLTPRNCQEIRLEFRRDKMAKAVGSISGSLSSGTVSGVLVTKDFNDRLMAPQDIETYTQLKLGGVKQRLHLPFYSSLEALVEYFREVYEQVEVKAEGAAGHICVSDAVTVVLTPGDDKSVQTLEFCWDASPVNDMMADSLVALAVQAQVSPGGIRLNSSKAGAKCKHSHGGSENESVGDIDNKDPLSVAMELVETLLVDSYGSGNIVTDASERTVQVKLDDRGATVRVREKSCEEKGWECVVEAEEGDSSGLGI